MFQVQDLRDARQIDSGGEEFGDSSQPIEVVVAVTAGAPSLRAGVSNPRRFVEPQGLWPKPLNSAATEMP